MHTVRKPPNRHRIGLVSCVIGALLAVGGCSGGDEPRPRSEELITATRAPASAPALRGIVGVTGNSAPDSASMLTVLDPATGEVMRSVSLGFVMADRLGSTGRGRPAFSADRSMVAGPSLDGVNHMIVLARYDGTQYAVAGSWTAVPSTYGEVAKYAEPRFNPADGRLWFLRQVEVPDGPDKADGWFSVDPVHAGSAPRAERTSPDTVDAQGRPVVTTTVPIDELDGTAAEATVRSSPAGLLSATIDEASNLDDISEASALQPRFSYTCDQQITTDELLCWATTQADGLGSVTGISLTRDRKQAVVRAIFPSPLGRTTGRALLSPDRRTVLQSTSDGWFSGDVDGLDVPEPAFSLPASIDAADYFAWF